MDALDFCDQLQWTAEAKAKLKNIPYFVRSQARQWISEILKIHFSEQLNR
ncbi:MAG: PCP reductase family protein [Microcystis aeruginosa]